jgi:hypothetical protein
MVKMVEKPPIRSNRNSDFFFFKPRFIVWIVLCFLVSLVWMSSEEFIIWKEGDPELSPERQGKLERELWELENAEQYVLRARYSGYFPCYSCGEQMDIFLFVGEVWRYGVTRKGEKGRYSTGLPNKKLLYLVEYEGPLQECLKQEKMKIYSYALLPENIKRKTPLIRPPGNKRDD